MNTRDYPKQKIWRRGRLVLGSSMVALICVFVLVWYSLKIFSFHSNVSPINGNISGEVFRSSDGVFLVRLDSGSQLIVRLSPPRVFLSQKSTRGGIQIGGYLIVPAASIDGVDLSKSESFSRQVPVISKGKIVLKDPLQRGGSFYFLSGYH
jgi:hypothetical protein